MHFVITDTTDSRTAALAFSNLAPIFNGYVIRLDPFSTTPGRTVHPISCCVFLELAIPCLFEILIEEPINVPERNVIRGAAPRRHVCRVSDGHVEDAPEAGMAHTV